MSQHMQFTIEKGLSLAIGNIESLIECLRRGTIHIAHRGSSIVLKPVEPICLELQVRSRQEKSKREERLILTLEWEREAPWHLDEGFPCHLAEPAAASVHNALPARRLAAAEGIPPSDRRREATQDGHGGGDGDSRQGMERTPSPRKSAGRKTDRTAAVAGGRKRSIAAGE